MLASGGIVAYRVIEACCFCTVGPNVLKRMCLVVNVL